MPHIPATARVQRQHRRIPAGVCVSVGAMVGMGLLLPSSLSAADVIRRGFDIPAGDAEVTLKQFTAQSGEQLLYSPDDVSGVRTHAVHGEFTPIVALEHMLMGTRLKARQDGKTKAIAITAIAAPRAAPRSTGPAESFPAQQTHNPAENSPTHMKPKNLLALVGSWLLATVSTNAQSTGTGTAAPPPQADKAPVQLPIFEVSQDKDEGYLSTQTTSGSRTVEVLRNVPSTISILNRELMDDLNITSITELSAYGVTGEVDDQTDSTAPRHVFRGVVAATRLRNGLKTLSFMDSYNIERVELLRGPNSFLYGEGTVGGTPNQLTKQGKPWDFQKVNLLFGSHGLHRIELDVNRHIPRYNLSVRANLAYQNADGFVNHTKREFRGAYVAVSYHPFPNTHVNLNVEGSEQRATTADGILQDAFSNTERAATTVAYTATTGGTTLFPATGGIYNMVGQRRSSGTNTTLFNTAILPRTANYYGPNSHHNVDNKLINFSISQKIGENLNLQGSIVRYNNFRTTRNNAGSSSAGVYLDTNRMLPDGTPNPYFNEYYTEYYVTRLQHKEIIHDARVTAVYDWKLPFMSQQIIISGSLQDDIPDRVFNRMSEFVDPSSPRFSGSLIDANTLAAYQANVTTLGRNRLYRRFYLRDGDGARFTHNNIVPGESVMLRDSPADGTTGRLSDRKFETPSWGIGLSGKYFNGRLNTLVGWRRDGFVQRTLSRRQYNHFTQTEFKAPESTTNPIHIYEDSHNYGAVFHVSKMLSAYANYAQSVQLSSGFGGAGLRPGTVRGVGQGDGYEYGLRWSFFDGKIESSWTYYMNYVLKQAATPGIPTAARNELAAIFGGEINQSGGDHMDTDTSGFEFETIANVTKNWRLIWNMSTNELATSNRYPALRSFMESARSQNIPVPETEAFLQTVPDGTPVPGYTKFTSNLVTNYRFDGGVFKGFTVGGGFQYRDKSFRGNFDFDRDGSAESVWTPAYFLANVTVGYRTRLLNRPVNLNLSVNNVLDKDYFKSRGVGTGAWGEGRSFRIAIRTDL